MKTALREKVGQIWNYPFFQSVGAPLPSTVKQVESWPVAAKMCSSRKWGNCRLAARNALKRAVETRCWSRMEDWDPLATELQGLIAGFVEIQLPKAPIQSSILQKIKEDLSWDIMLICFEYEYRDVTEPVFHLPFLDPWYGAGHFPCGWDGEEFPETLEWVTSPGKLCVL